LFLYSPLAISATENMRRHPVCYADDARRVVDAGEALTPPGLRFVRETADSIALNMITGGAVIMAGSGMCTGGRVRHHLRNHLWREASSIIFVGFAAEGTLAREIIDGATTVKIFGESVRVRTHVHTINGFSAHADQHELVDWQNAAGTPRTFLVHGEPDRGMRAMAELLASKGRDVVLPKVDESFEIA
jgi:metallo-beta-lactamase family protein